MKVRHKFNIFPPMPPDEFAVLTNDMKENGYDDKFPITLYYNDILDGWNRYQACEQLGIEPVYESFNGSDTEAVSFVMRTNKRRNLTSSQWATIAVEAEDIIATITKEVDERKREANRVEQIRVEELKRQEQEKVIINTGLANKLANPVTQIEPLPEAPELQAPKQKRDHGTRTESKVAEVFNTNREYVKQAKKIQQEAPAEFEKIKAGEKTITEYKKEQKTKERIQVIQEQREAIENGTVVLPTGVFEVVAMDPPWAYGRNYAPNTSRVASPYPEMTQAELLELNPPFADDCVLFLWTTHQFIWDAKELMDKWAFTYKATLVWNKDKMGMGSWLRMQCEFCLVGIKGKPTWNNITWRDIINEKSREHSRKPELFYEMVNSITVGRKLDCFSREPRNGWEVYGNDTNKF